MANPVTFPKPPEYTPIGDGLHICELDSVKISEGKFGQQIEFLWRSNLGRTVRTWAGLNHYKKLAELAAIGVLIDDGETYTVNPNPPQIALMVVDGKVVSIGRIAKA